MKKILVFTFLLVAMFCALVLMTFDARAQTGVPENVKVLTASSAETYLAGNTIRLLDLVPFRNDTVYLVTFGINKQIHRFHTLVNNGDIVPGTTGFFPAKGALYSKDLNSLINYINSNNYSLNTFYFDGVKGEDNQPIWSYEGGQLRDVKLGERLTVQLAVNFWVGREGGWPMYDNVYLFAGWHELPSLTINGAGQVGPNEGRLGDYTVVADRTGPITISFNTGPSTLYNGDGSWTPNDNILILNKAVYEVSLTLKSSTNMTDWIPVLTNIVETYNPQEFYKNDISVRIKAP